MKNYLNEFSGASKEIKRFVFTIASIGLILVVTTAYAYMRLS